LGEVRLPFVIVFTKVDKSKPEEIEANISAFQAKLLETWEVLPPNFITSSDKKQGKVEILEFIEEINLKFAAQQP